MKPVSIKEWLSEYKRWRKQVLLFTLIELLIVLVIIAVLLAWFLPKIIGGVKDTRCATAMLNLKNYVKDLNLRLADTGATIDPDTERQKLEDFIKEIKKDCSDPTVTGNNELKNELNAMLTTLTNTLETRPEEQKSAWQKLKDAAAGLAAKYFP